LNGLRVPSLANGIKRVLVIEDDPGMLTILRIKLKHEGLEVVTARNESEAVLRAESESPNVSLLDSYLPVSDEAGFLTKLRGEAGRPVIVFSFRGEPGTSELENQADVFVPIPFDVDRIAKQVRKLCGVERSRRP
jgi:two-component system OmpR family response regulator